MPDEFHNSLISDIKPRTTNYRRREVSFIRRPYVDYGQPLDNVLPPAPQRHEHRQDSHSLPKGLLNWNPKYLGGFMGVAAVLLLIVGSRASVSAPLITSTPSIYTQQEVDQEKVDPGLPVRLKIPKIGVDAALDYVGLTTHGDMDAPKNPAYAGWYKEGPRPGEKGNSVIDGHFGYRNRIPAVFDNLYKLQKGDKIYVKDKKGATISFVVRESRRYDPEAVASDVFRSNDGLAHLNLITCQGVWNQNQKSYSNRLVVFADKKI
jgi:LPXTG-site transpeptidase (sortase) family protein